MNIDHIPTPLAHTPTIERDDTSGVYDLMLVEEDSSVWIHAENPAEVRE